MPISIFWTAVSQSDKDSSIRRTSCVLIGALVFSASLSVASAQTPTTIRVGLLANRSFSAVTLDGYSGLRASGQRAQGTLKVTAKGPVVEVSDGKALHLKLAVVTVASRGGRWIDIGMEGRTLKRTVGWLQISAKSGQLHIVNTVPLETYVLGIVDSELGSVHFNPESLKAQIVASRSYVLASRGRHKHDGFDFCDTPHCQAFGGTSAIRSDFKLAVETSRGEYLSYGGHPIPAYFHDNCGGRTASIQDVWGTGALPYLQGVQDGAHNDPYCRFAPRAHWHFAADRRTLGECFRKEGWIAEHEALDSLHVVSLDPSGRAQQVLIQSNHPLWVPAVQVRQALNRYFGSEVLSSTVFVIKREKDNFYFIGRGWGHGVGLCQWGAIQMAKEGKTYREILQHYYPGTQIDRLPEPQYAISNFKSHLRS